MAGLLAWDVVEWGGTIFVHYTEWTFALVMVYFVVYPSQNEERSDFQRSDLEESTDNGREKGIIVGIKTGFWGYLMQIAFQTCESIVILTDVVFWCVTVPFLSNAHLGLNMMNFSILTSTNLDPCFAVDGFMHNLNVVFLLLDTTLNNLATFVVGRLFELKWEVLYALKSCALEFLESD
ncbi:hypothetical protein UlMin_037198 [Ulmus minor]